ncbi:uncharacterized protein LOC143571842 [Bidens hawaiensis]|uniref:uncharacterized protein LOC143571842 n=1 Tax=Bidens hawaiensis TaxID=980011 RepID=UPI00404B6E5D
MDKFHWYLCGLGPSFEKFSVSIRNVKPAPLFRDLVSQAKSHEIFMQTIHGNTTPPAAFTAQHGRRDSSSNRNRGANNHDGQNRGGSNSDHGNSSQSRSRFFDKRPPKCQICQAPGHYATSCPDLYKYAKNHSTPDESLAKAFHAQCHVTNNTPDWNVDSGATAHMTPEFDSLHQSAPYQGNHGVIFVNGMSLPITHTGGGLPIGHLYYQSASHFFIG